MAIDLSIIIPVLNEAEALPGLLSRLQEEVQANPHLNLEIVVVDGGSTDGSREVAKEPAARLVRSERGRSKQLNRGAALARGKVLVFLHADSQISPGFSSRIVKAVDSGSVGGAHHVMFSPANGWLKLVAWGSNLRGRYLKSYYGDQGIFVRKDVFRQLGGFPDQELMEDLEFSRKLRKAGPTVFLPGCLLTSSRRFIKGGILKTLLLMQWLKILYLIGVSPQRLKKLYDL